MEERWRNFATVAAKDRSTMITFKIRTNECSAMAYRQDMADEWAIMTAVLAYCGIQQLLIMSK